MAGCPSCPGLAGLAPAAGLHPAHAGVRHVPRTDPAPAGSPDRYGQATRAAGGACAVGRGQPSAGAPQTRASQNPRGAVPRSPRVRGKEGGRGRGRGLWLCGGQAGGRERGVARSARRPSTRVPLRSRDAEKPLAVAAAGVAWRRAGRRCGARGVRPRPRPLAPCPLLPPWSRGCESHQAAWRYSRRLRCARSQGGRYDADAPGVSSGRLKRSSSLNRRMMSAWWGAGRGGAGRGGAGRGGAGRGAWGAGARGAQGRAGARGGGGAWPRNPGPPPPAMPGLAQASQPEAGLAQPKPPLAATPPTTPPPAAAHPRVVVALRGVARDGLRRQAAPLAALLKHQHRRQRVGPRVAAQLQPLGGAWPHAHVKGAKAQLAGRVPGGWGWGGVGGGGGRGEQAGARALGDSGGGAPSARPAIPSASTSLRARGAHSSATSRNEGAAATEVPWDCV
jgi:hypothetical protein